MTELSPKATDTGFQGAWHQLTKEGSVMSSHTPIHSDQTMWERGDDFSVS